MANIALIIAGGVGALHSRCRPKRHLGAVQFHLFVSYAIVYGYERLCEPT